MKKYYLQNKEQGYVGNAILWWAEGGNGYTVEIDKAEKFSEDKVRELIRNNTNGKFIAWDSEYIDRSKGKITIVDMQYLRFHPNNNII